MIGPIVGSALTVRLRHGRIAEHEEIQRFVLGRERTTAELGVALDEAVPLRFRPTGAGEAASWNLRRLHDGRMFTRAELFDERPMSLASAGILPGSTFELELTR